MSSDSKKIRTHKDLDVWKKSIELAQEIYRFTKNFPQEEIYGLTSQIRRSIISVPSNIAEGAARRTTKEFIQFLSYAAGSLAEVETQLILSSKVGYLKNKEDVFGDVEDVKKMLGGLIKSLERKTNHKSQITDHNE